MITQEITLELSIRSDIPYLYAKQGDCDVRNLLITLTDNGTTYLPRHMEAYFRARTPEGTEIYEAGTINSDGTITVALPKAALASAGTVAADICLVGQSGEVLSSTPFRIHVDPIP